MKKYTYSLLLLSQVLFAQNYTSDQWLSQGKELISNEKYEESISVFNKIHSLDPHYFSAQTQVVNALLYNEKYQEGVQLAAQLFEKYKDTEPSVYWLYGISLSYNDQLAEAHKIFDEGLKKYPYNSELLYNKAVVYSKQEEKQKALDYYKKVLDTDPFYISALHNVGVIALNDGKIVEGTLALMMQIMIAPFHYASRNAVLLLNKKYHQNYSGKSKLNYSASGDDFSELEQLLLSQIQYHKDYKLKINVDDLAVRNIQFVIEYLSNHDIKNGYFENKFVSLFKKIAQENQTQNFLYASLIPVGDAFEKELSKNAKVINNYIENYLVGELIPSYREVTINNEKYRVFKEDNDKYYVPVDKDGNANGIGFFIDSNGIKKFEQNYKDDAINGKKTFFGNAGNVLSTVTLKNGILEGEATENFSNNNLFVQYTFSNNVISGNYKRYYPLGGLECEGMFQNNEYEGEFTCYHHDGTVEVKGKYSKGYYTGNYKKYNELKQLIEDKNYLDGELHGDYLTYYPDGTLKEKGLYDKGNMLEHISYYPNKNKETFSYYSKGKITTIDSFDFNGTLTKKDYFNTKEELEKSEYYNYKGELYQVHHFKKGKYHQSEYIFNKTKNTDSSTFTSYNQFGKVVVKGQSRKGNPVGVWQYFNDFGLLESQSTFDNEGNKIKEESFLNNGDKDYVVEIKDDNYHGKYEDFYNNKLKFITYFTENNQHGPKIQYTEDGNVQMESFYQNGQTDGIFNTYSFNGKLLEKEVYVKNNLHETTYFLDSKPSSFVYANKTGTFTFDYSPLIRTEFELKNGVYHGTYKGWNKGQLIHDLSYNNGKTHGTHNQYSINGKLIRSTDYYLDKKHGTDSIYDEMGNLFYTENYTWGEFTGAEKLYFFNGKLQRVTERIKEKKTGIEQYFNPEEKVIATIEYVNDVPVAYQILNKDEQLTEKIPFTDGKLSMVSKYANGSTALTIDFNDRLRDGRYEVYYENAKIAIKKQYNKGKLVGISEDFYPNGKVYRLREIDKQNYAEGKEIFLAENGDKILEINTKENYLHGDYIIYENNTIKKKHRYDSNFLVE